MCSAQIKSKNIPILYSSTLIGGLLFFLPILALYFEKNLFSITNVAIIFSIEAVAFAIFEIPTGAVADLFGRKNTLILSNIINLVALIFLYVGGSMFIFILYAVINSFARSLSSGTDIALIYDTLKEEKKEESYKKVIGTYYTLWPIGASIGSIVGGFLAGISLSLPILITFIPLTIAAVLAFFLKEPKYKKENHKNIFKHMIDSSKIIISNRQLLLLMLGGLITMALGESAYLLRPLFFQFKEIPIVYFGWISASVFGFSAMGHYMSHTVSEKIGNKKLIILTLISSSLLSLIATLTAGFTSAILLAITSLFFGLRNPVISHMLNLEIPSSKRATVLSASNLFGQLGLAIFAPFLGYLAEIYTINTAFRISALLAFAVPVIYFFLKDKKNS